MKPAFDVKSARLDVLAVQLHTADLTELEEFLRQRTGQYRELDVVPFILDVQAEPQPKAATPAPVQTPAAGNPTVLVSTPVRTGQQVYAENADLIVTGAVSQGAELIADGNIHVYAPMRGRALAGAGGNRNARIFIHSMQAELVSVAGIYRNFEQDLPDHLHKKPVQISLQDDRLVISAIDAE